MQERNIEYIEQIKNIKDKISEEELNNVYMYLSMFFEEMDPEEKKMWIEIIDLIDPEKLSENE